MVLLKVVSTPSDDLVNTNIVFVSPHDHLGTNYVELRGYVFTLQPEDRVEKGTIAFNSIQRKCAALSMTAGDSVDVKAGFKAPSAAINFLKLEVDYTAKRSAPTVLDCEEYCKFIRHKFSGQYFGEGQQFATITETARFMAKVVKMECVSGKTGNSCAELVEETKILLCVPSGSAIRLDNQPEEEQAATQIFNTNKVDFETLGIGGLGKEFGELMRRAFASRIFPRALVKKLGIPHVKGILLHGPPGTGKTLLARQIGKMLNCATPKIVAGPEMFDKYVGASEAKVRSLFAEAEAEYAAKGESSQLHVIIFDEFECIVKQRGQSRDSTGVGDNVVNQLLSKIDGVESINNVLLIGMTNRKDLIDDAILRPGRFELHIEIGLPDEAGRREIFVIHTSPMKKNGLLAADVNLDDIAARTKNYSGAEIAGVARAASSHAFSRHIDMDNPSTPKDIENLRITQHDFIRAIDETKPAFGAAVDECRQYLRSGLYDYGMVWHHIMSSSDAFINTLSRSNILQTYSVLIEGPVGAGKTSVAAQLAVTSGFPFVKFVAADSMVGMGELAKCNIIRKAFEDAYKSSLSVVILDNIERLIEYAHIGQRYSNAVLQTLLVLVKRQPPEGKKIMVVGTTSCLDVLQTMELSDAFSRTLEIPNIDAKGMEAVLQQMKVTVEPPEQRQEALDLLFEADMPMKKFIEVIETACMQSPLGDRDSTNRALTVDSLRLALMK